MMRHFTKYLFLLFWVVLPHVTSFGQNDLLAQNYFENGQFEKAENLYQTLHEEQPNNFLFFERLIQSQQELQKYEEAEKTILQNIERISKFSFANQFDYLWVELGFNYELKHEYNESKLQYNKALESITKNPNFGYKIAKSFQDHQKLDEALQCYQIMMAAFPTANYWGQVALVYGEKGEIVKMFDTYLDMMSMQNNDMLNTQRFMARFLTDDDSETNNVLLRKLLVQRIQVDPRIEWFKTLSWLYILQQDYSKALIQEIAVHKKDNTLIGGVMDLGKIAFEGEDFNTAQKAFEDVSAQSIDITTKMEGYYYFLESLKSQESDITVLDLEYQQFFSQFGKGISTVKVQISYAQFLTFFKNAPEKGIEVLKEALKNNLDRFLKSEIKIQMADILVFTSQSNQALLTYTQVQNELKNHPLAQTARFKVAQTSYYKGDFGWANAQLKVLKSGTSKLIANDALDLSLHISDNIAEDSIQIALKRYATAELLAYQNKTQQAIDTLQIILIQHKGHAIEDEALYKQAEYYEKMKKYEAAEGNYLKILQIDPDDILIDDALYQLAILYDEKLYNPEKAQLYYEKIVLEQSSSIYVVPARKRYRELRGDTMIP